MRNLGTGRAGYCPHHQDIVCAGGGHFQGSFGGGLAADIPEVRRAIGFRAVAIAVPGRGRELIWLGKQPDHFAEVAQTVHADRPRQPLRPRFRQGR